MGSVRLDVHAAHEIVKREGGTPLDVVDSAVYEKVPWRIKGGMRIAPEDIPQRYQELPEGKVVLAYCT